MATTKKAAAPAAETVSHAKPKAAPKKKPTAKEQAAANVAKMRQANLAITQPAAIAEIMQIPVNFIHCAAQVRTEFNEKTIRELAEDIAERTLIQPILVRRLDDGFQVVAGERRYRAAKLANLDMIPAIVTDIDAEAAEAVQIAENIQREDLSLADTAKAVRKLYERNGNSVTATATKLHKSKAWVSKHLAASCPDLQHMARAILEGGFTEDLEIILTLDKLYRIDWTSCQELCQKIKKGEAGRQTVRETYEAAKIKKEKADDELKNQMEKAATPEALAQHKALVDKQKKQQAEAEAAARVNPEHLRWMYDEELDDEQKKALGNHLQKLHKKAQSDKKNFRRELLTMMHHNSQSPIEIAAYITGHENEVFDLDKLITEVNEIEGNT